MTIHVLRDEHGYPHHAVVLKVPDDAWAQKDGNPGFVEFAVYESPAAETDGTPLYNTDAQESCTGDWTPDIEAADPLVEGSVKWDGCVNWTVKCDKVMLHHCSTLGINQLLTSIGVAYAAALEAVGGGLD